MPARLENEMIIDAKIRERLVNMPYYVKEWHTALQASQVTASSRRDMISKVNRFLESIDPDVKNVSIDKIKDLAVNEYYISIATKKDSKGKIVQTSDSYKQCVYCTLKNFLGYLANKGYIEKNYMDDIKKPKNHDLERIKENRVRLTRNDFEDVITQVQCEDRPELRCRDEAILRIFMGTGMRKTALRILDVSDIDFENKKLTTIDKGKGGKRQTYPLGDSVIKALKKWLEYREENIGAGDSDALFLSRNGTRLSDKGITKIVEKYFIKATGKHVSPHKIRGGVASILYDEKGDIEYVRRVIGHEKSETTQRYITTANTEREDAAALLSF